MNIIEQLTEKYGLATDSYYTENPYKKEQGAVDIVSSVLCFNREQELSAKWKDRVVERYYGISLGYPVPLNWFDVIDDFLNYVEKTDPDFGIYQIIKIKFGQMRCYLANVSEETQGYIRQLETLLSDKFLIY